MRGIVLKHSLVDDRPSFGLEGRIALVTGASEGIGREFALAFGRAGAEVVLVSRTKSKLAEVHSQIETNGGKAHVLPADLSNLRDIASMADKFSSLVDGRHDKLVLVNNAGFAFTKSALEVTEEEWDRVIDLHVKATFFCCQQIGKLMLERNYGKIINLSSTWSTSTENGKSTYGVAKAAISYLTSALSTEWAPKNVRVNAIAPTATLSENTRKNLENDPERARKRLARIKLGRFGEPGDLVGAAIFLAGPASDFITGHTLFVDGGWHAAS